MIWVQFYMWRPVGRCATFPAIKKVWFFSCGGLLKQLDLPKAIRSNRKLQILQSKTAKIDHFIRFQIWKSLNLKSRMKEKIKLSFCRFSCTGAFSDRESCVFSFKFYVEYSECLKGVGVWFFLEIFFSTKKTNFSFSAISMDWIVVWS